MGLEWITRETTKKCFRWNPTSREARADKEQHGDGVSKLS